MELGAKSRLGPYEIIAPIGEGGMGTVYKALDTRLDRTVAIKVSKEQFSERFEREARAVAALNHPHICTLYDVGPNYLVMEFIDGTPLPGPLPLEKVVEYADQILDALDAAHRKGITHRDLKPANILVARQGIKLLDFGLAKQAVVLKETDATLTAALTGHGQIAGTLQYMAPEQLQGKEADARSDLFAFGCVLYEMVTGKRAFEGENAASVIAAIMEREPAPPEVAPPLDRVIRICLAKDPERRFQNALDLKIALDWAVEQPPAEPAPVSRRAYLAGGAGLLVGGASAWLLRGPQQASGRPVQFQVAPRPGQAILAFSLSPDGNYLAMIIAQDGKTGLWLRRLDSDRAQFVPGSEGANVNTPPFWSPASRQVGFAQLGLAQRAALLKYTLDGGGAAELVCRLEAGIRGATWNAGGTILFGTFQRGLWRCPAGGGTPELVADVQGAEYSLYHPVFLPDGEHYLYVRRGLMRDLYAGRLGSPDSTRIGELSGRAEFVPSARLLLFAQADSVYAQRFDPRSLRLSGSPWRIAPKVGIFDFNASAGFSVSDRGVVAWSTRRRDLSELFWVDRAGKRLARVGELDVFHPWLYLSPDSRSVLIQKADSASGLWDLYAVDVQNGRGSRLTFSKSSERFGSAFALSPDGKQIAYELRAGADTRIVRQQLGGGAPQTMAHTSANISQWSPGDRFLVLDRVSSPRRCDLMALDPPHAILPLHGPQAHWGQAAFSPNGRYVAYIDKDLFVEPFPATGARWQIAENGLYPVWRRDGKEMFFVAAGRLMVTEVKTDSATFQFSPPRALFEVRFAGLSYARPFDVTPDGQRFLLCEPREDPDNPPVTVLVNWQQSG